MKNYTLTLKNFPLIYKRFFNIHKNIHIEILAWCKVVVIYIYRKHFISWVNFVFWKIRGRKSIFYVFWPVSVLFCFSVFFFQKSFLEVISKNRLPAEFSWNLKCFLEIFKNFRGKFSLFVRFIYSVLFAGNVSENKENLTLKQNNLS